VFEKECLNDSISPESSASVFSSASLNGFVHQKKLSGPRQKRNFESTKRRSYLSGIQPYHRQQKPPTILRSDRMKKYTKKEFPVSDIRRFLEPGPIVLISSAWKGKTNIMTLGWHTVMEFSPSLIGCVIANSNFSFEMIRKPRVRDQCAVR
jgi:hypothetical protein